MAARRNHLGRVKQHDHELLIRYSFLLCDYHEGVPAFAVTEKRLDRSMKQRRANAFQMTEDLCSDPSFSFLYSASIL